MCEWQQKRNYFLWIRTEHHDTDKCEGAICLEETLDDGHDTLAAEEGVDGVRRGDRGGGGGGGRRGVNGEHEAVRSGGLRDGKEERKMEGERERERERE